jgi:hypothetical protein
MSSSKIIDLQIQGLCGKCFTVWGPEPQIPPLHTVLYTCIQYTYSLFTQGRGGGWESWTRENGRRATQESTDHKAGLKIPTWLNVHKKSVISSRYTLIYTCRKVLLQVNFSDDDILHCLLWTLLRCEHWYSLLCVMFLGDLVLGECEPLSEFTFVKNYRWTGVLFGRHISENITLYCENFPCKSQQSTWAIFLGNLYQCEVQ